jgi:Membrane bound O-acyl transferase family
MWSLAVAIYASLKWLTFATSPAARQTSWLKAAGYLFLWTGMDTDAFFGRHQRVAESRWSEWMWATGQTAAGLGLLLFVAPQLAEAHPMIGGWVAMAGVASTLHFGVSRLLSAAWRTVGVDAVPIMHQPVLAASLADFWGRRWNLAFRDLAYRFVLRPLTPIVGGPWALMAVFLASGLVHDAVISLSAGGGWGLPTAYFLIQGVGTLIERSRLGRRIGLGRGTFGWLYAAAVVVGPVGLLFHPPYVLRVVVPMMDAISRALP